MKKYLLVVFMVAILAGSIIGVASAQTNRFSQANGQGKGFLNMLELKAKVLGMTLVQLKDQLLSGKTFATILQEKNITFSDFQTKMRQQKQSEQAGQNNTQQCGASGTCSCALNGTSACGKTCQNKNKTCGCKK